MRKKKREKRSKKNKAKSTPGLRKRNTFLSDSSCVTLKKGSFLTSVPYSHMHLAPSDFDSQALILKFSGEEGKPLFSV